MTINRLRPLVLGVIVLLCDFLSKYYVQLYLPLMKARSWYPYGGIGVFKNLGGIEFSITHAINKGAAWGMFSQYQQALLVLRVLLIAGLVVYYFFFNRKEISKTPLMLIIAGAIGNIMDYFLYGHVIDMLHFVLWGYDFPVFNLADSAIFIGICWLMLLSWTDQKTSLGLRSNAIRKHKN